ncbi:MAG: hypothetical protein L6277_02220 [Desulfobacterales bacterium]|nr:hypothetical protein [Pseudomonadota bacterium]MCG2770891.1 hypothetical protein [Desulfobacterales bacterium]
MMNPKEMFSQLLDRLKNDEPVYTTEPEHISALRRPAPTPQLRSWAIRIMESPMFYKGGLRGKKLPVAGKIEYKSIPIQDLESLVMLLASDLDRHASGKLGRVVLKTPYDRVLKDLDEIISLAMVASDYLGKKRILTVRKKLYELREKMPPFFREPDLIYLVDLRLDTFVPDAGVSETAGATELLLTHLGLPVKRERVRRRRYREKARDE